MSTIKKFSLGGIALLLLLASGISGCGDTAPTSYAPEYLVEGFLIVDEPIQGIRVSLTQSVADSFKIANSVVKDADVKIAVNGRTLQLAYKPNEGMGEYYFPDTSEVVQPGTVYNITVTTADGKVLTGGTKTPGRTGWVKVPHDTVQYPKDTTNLPSPDSLKYAWVPVEGVSEYILESTCLDTLEYGKYLTPPTEEKNRRVVHVFNAGAEGPHANDRSQIGFIQATESPMIWFAFKWFGPHTWTVFAPDQNFVNWYKMTYWQRSPQYNFLFGNIKGGLGVFASASIARQNVFVYKNQP